MGGWTDEKVAGRRGWIRWADGRMNRWTGNGADDNGVDGDRRTSERVDGAGQADKRTEADGVRQIPEG